MTNHWDSKRNEYRKTDWSKEPTLFAQFVLEYFPKEGDLLELGAGIGQDSTFFAEHGFDVTSTDLVIDDKEEPVPSIKRMQLDHSKPLPFDSESFDIVYSHLSIHYFDHETTAQVIAEIERVLKVGGVVAFLCNSTNDPEYGTGVKIEDDYFETEGTRKRYFSQESAHKLAERFNTILCDSEGESFKDRAKGIHGLIRYVGRKR